MPSLGIYSPQPSINADYLGRLVSASTDTTPALVVGIDVVTSGSVTNDFDVVVPDKFETIFIIARKDGAGAANTVTVKNGATAISDAIAFAVDKAVTVVGTIDTASNVIAAGGTLRVTVTRVAGTVAGLVTVIGLLRP